MDTKVARIPAELHARAVALADELGTTTAEAIARLAQGPTAELVPVEAEELALRPEPLDLTPYLENVGARLARIEGQQHELMVGMAGLAAGQLEIVRDSDEALFKQRVFAAMQREAERRGLSSDVRRVLSAIEALPEGSRHDT